MTGAISDQGGKGPSMPKPLSRRGMRDLFKVDVASSKTPTAVTRTWNAEDWHAVSRELDGTVTIVCQPLDTRANGIVAHVVALAVFREIVNSLAMPFERLERGALRERHQPTAYSFEYKRHGKMTDSLMWWRQWYPAGHLPAIEEK